MCRYEEMSGDELRMLLAAEDQRHAELRKKMQSLIKKVRQRMCGRGLSRKREVRTRQCSKGKRLDLRGRSQTPRP